MEELMNMKAELEKIQTEEDYIQEQAQGISQNKTNDSKANDSIVGIPVSERRFIDDVVLKVEDLLQNTEYKNITAVIETDYNVKYHYKERILTIRYTDLRNYYKRYISTPITRDGAILKASDYIIKMIKQWYKV